MIADPAQRPKDDAQRREALDVTRSFIVQAPAGSGKTELLVQRYLKLLSVVEKPEEILAITFTRKAAAEMRLRVLKNLPGGPAAAADIAHRLRIQTIDALCVALTSQMPVLSRFGAQPAIAEDPGELYREAASRVFQDLNPSTEKLLRHLDNDVPAAIGLLAQMLGTRDRWLRKTGVVPTREELEGALVLERDKLLQKARSLHPEASEELARELLTKDFTWRKKNAAAQALAQQGELGEPLRQALEALCKMPPAAYTDSQWEALEAILALLKPAVAQLKILFGETGKADFTEFAHGALQALGSVDDPTDLLLGLDKKISHILLDEFQDTSLSQFELIGKLVAGWEPGDGRTLFLVGDPMQSIYRFREAEVSLFLRTKSSGLGPVMPEFLTLRSNFRSQAGVIDWVNASFKDILPAAEDETAGAVPYSPSTAQHPALAGAAVRWHCFYDRSSESQRVVEILKEAAGKCAILVRNRAHLDHIVPALKDAGIRFRAVEIEQLGEKQVVQDLYALTRALAHLGDRIAALAVLRAPWCGLTLSDLHALVSGKAAQTKQADLFDVIEEKNETESGRAGFLVSDLMRNVSHLSADGQKRLARVREVLDASWRNRLRGTLRDRVEGAWLALGGPACVESETELEDADIFLDELERLEDAGSVDLDKLGESLGKLYALPDVDAGPDAVQIMTIHKAKGLEFDTVIVPGLDRVPRGGPRQLLAWKSVFSGPPDKGVASRAAASGGLLLAPINETGTDKEPAYNYIRDLEKEAEDIESGRLFYVAATRARQRLHLLACARSEEAEDGHAIPREPNKRSLLAKIWRQAQEHFGPDLSEAANDPTIGQHPDVLRRLPADLVLPSLPEKASWMAPVEGREEQQIEFSWAGETARHVGTVVHRWLQRIAEDELRGWDAARIAVMKERFQKELERRGVTPREAETSAQHVAAALANALSDERGRWVLGPHPDARSEHRIRVRSENGTRSYVMDRLFRDSGVLWIVDYKTSRHEGSDVERFLDQELARYSGQLEAYGAILEGSRQGLYFPVLRGWRIRGA